MWQPDTHARIDRCDRVLLKAESPYRFQECGPESRDDHRSIEEHRRAEPFMIELRHGSINLRTVVVIARNPGRKARGKRPLCENRNFGAESRHDDPIVGTRT